MNEKQHTPVHRMSNTKTTETPRNSGKNISDDLEPNGSRVDSFDEGILYHHV